MILGGAAGPKTIKDIVEFCDGWMPISGRHDLAGPIEEVRQAAEDAGRDPATIEFGQFGTPGKPDVIESLEEAGVSRVVLWLPPEGPDTALPLLDSYTELL